MRKRRLSINAKMNNDRRWSWKGKKNLSWLSFPISSFFLEACTCTGTNNVACLIRSCNKSIHMIFLVVAEGERQCHLTAYVQTWIWFDTVMQQTVLLLCFTRELTRPHLSKVFRLVHACYQFWMPSCSVLFDWCKVTWSLGNRVECSKVAIICNLKLPCCVCTVPHQPIFYVSPFSII